MKTRFNTLLLLVTIFLSCWANAQTTQNTISPFYDEVKNAVQLSRHYKGFEAYKQLLMGEGFEVVVTDLYNNFQYTNSNAAFNSHVHSFIFTPGEIFLVTKFIKPMSADDPRLKDTSPDHYKEEILLILDIRYYIDSGETPEIYEATRFSIISRIIGTQEGATSSAG